MENKLYTFILFILFYCFLSARAQDTTRCNPNFGVYTLGSQATFAAVDTHAHIQHYWNFGDSSTAGFNSNLAIAYHNYSHSGVFTVTHIIKDSLRRGCFDSTAQSVSITIPPPCAVYVQVERDTFDHHIYNFYASYVISGGVHDSITWYINDSLVGTGPSLLHYYLSGGLYTVCAKLVSRPCRAENCQQVMVEGADSCGISPSFGYVADSSNSRHIYFIPVPDSSAYSYLWNFGDGSYSTVRRADHYYSYGGNYKVSLTVTKHTTRLDSCQSHVNQEVYVNGAPPVTCSISFTYTRDPSNPNEVTFNALDSAGTDSLTWLVLNLADSLHPAYLSGHTPTYIFPDSGCYLVLLSATTPSGCQSSSQQTICTDSIPLSARNFISSYPNPAASEANINLNLTKDNTVRVTVFNSMGNQVLTKIVAGNKGPNHITLPISSLPKGIYYVQIQYGNEISRSKIQKL